MIYQYTKGFDEFPLAREELEATGIEFISVSTVDDALQVEVDLPINNPDFVAVE
jgi:hypothetical protein